jgi:O-antigen ligase
VIHSTAVWLLAETGFIGFAVFGAAGLRLLAEAVRCRAEPAALMLLLTLCAFGVISMAHEMLYQRAIWLLLGAMLAVPALTGASAVGRPVNAATV